MALSFGSVIFYSYLYRNQLTKYIMNVLKEVNGFKLNQGNLMADGLFNISDEYNNVSFWFDEETAQEMLNMTDEEFINDSIALINHAMYSV